MRIHSKYKHEWFNCSFAIPAGESELDPRAVPRAAEKKLTELFEAKLITVLDERRREPPPPPTPPEPPAPPASPAPTPSAPESGATGASGPAADTSKGKPNQPKKAPASKGDKPDDAG